MTLLGLFIIIAYITAMIAMMVFKRITLAALVAIVAVTLALVGAAIYAF
jgi:hypothetical protein